MTIAKPDDMAVPLKSMTLRAAFLFVRENPGLAIGKDKRQLMRKPLPVMQDFGSVLFLFFPTVREFHRAHGTCRPRIIGPPKQV
jgi:hypothetical protein